MKFTAAFFPSLFLAMSCQGQTVFQYDLSQPDLVHQLPPILNEVSGLTNIDNNHVALIQDELGIVFLYDFSEGKIVSQHQFESTGDFEGLAYADNKMYILRSDGRLTEWNNFPDQAKSVKHYDLNLPTSNNEGLCYDPKHNRVLIAAKSKPDHGYEKSRRLIYAFDLLTRKLLNKPLYSLNVDRLAEKAHSLGIEQSNLTEKGKQKPFNFRPSSLAIHPLTGDLYIISAVDFLMVVMNPSGKIIHMEPLEPERFPQAEGLTFLPDGTMIITSEAAGKVPTLQVFKMKMQGDH
ncbi:MAG: SdiA-regulated domain-containing protein [Bacteroidales bacterium]|nr:SdiA-regulated domain-containing protein [Bacteroidales bacterium]